MLLCLGTLKLPSKIPTALLTHIEKAIAVRSKSNVVFGDFFWCIVEDLTKGGSLVEVECSSHSEQLSARNLKFHLVTQIFKVSTCTQRHE